jgi:hypothetical protein
VKISSIRDKFVVELCENTLGKHQALMGKQWGIFPYQIIKMIFNDLVYGLVPVGSLFCFV